MKQHSLTEFYLERLQLDWLADRRMEVWYRLSLALTMGPVFGLAFGLDSWQRGGLVNGLVDGLLGGLFVGVGVFLVGSPANIQGIWQRAVLLVEVISGLGKTLSSELFDEQVLSSPNQQIWLLAQLRLILGLLVGLSAGLVSALGGGLVMGMAMGLGAFLQHFALRFWLWRRGAMPWRYVHFLEEATERILLQRVGGGYRFIHPLFLDYFASLGIPVSPPSVQPPPSRQP